MKCFYGTMDNEDREQIESHLRIIDKNNHHAIETINAQVEINDSFNKNNRKR